MKKEKTTGRPPLGAAKKKFYVTASFTEEDYKTMQNKATASGIKLAIFVSQAALRSKVVARYNPEELATIKELTYFNNNINQIAKTLNSLANNYGNREIENQVNRLENILDEIDKFFK